MTDTDSRGISPSGGSPVAAVLMFTLIWNTFAWHAAWGVLAKLPLALEQGQYGVLAFGVFPLVGLALIVWCIRTALHQWRFGKSRLQLNAGVIGGQVDGVIQISRVLPPNVQLKVALQCLHSREQRKSKGGRRVKSEVKWHAAMNGQIEPASQGTAVRFRFDVPADLPAPEPPGKQWHHWQLLVQAVLPGVDLNLDFELPLVATKQRSAAKTPAQSRQQQRERSEQLVKLLNPDQQGDTQFFDMPYGRGRDSAVMLVLAGVVFVGIGMLVMQKDNGTAASFMGGVFALAGAIMLGAALYIPFNRLQVAIDPAQVHVRRHWLGWQVSRQQLALSDIRRVESEERRSVSSGKNLVRYFRVVLVTATGKRIPVAEDIPGQAVADEAVRFLQQQTPLRSVLPKDVV